VKILLCEKTVKGNIAFGNTLDFTAEIEDLHLNYCIPKEISKTRLQEELFTSIEMVNTASAAFRNGTCRKSSLRSGGRCRRRGEGDPKSPFAGSPEKNENKINPAPCPQS
jgi:hypothetical protein